jgi:hypothetical protein
MASPVLVILLTLMPETSSQKDDGLGRRRYLTVTCMAPNSKVRSTWTPLAHLSRQHLLQRIPPESAASANNETLQPGGYRIARDRCFFGDRPNRRA